MKRETTTRLVGRPGRPALPDGEARDVTIKVRVTEAERERLQAAADREGVSVSERLRVRGLADA